MVQVRRELVWDYPIPTHPDADEAFLALYVGRVLDRGTAADVGALGLDLIRRFLPVAPARREVIDFWRWWLHERDRHPHRGAAPLPQDSGDGRTRRR